MPTIPITVIIRRDGIDVNPTYANVPNNPDLDVKLRWTLANATFPATGGCFAWKGTYEGAPDVTCPTTAGQTVIESATYRNNFATPGRVWQYKLTIVDPNDPEKTITIDPEVNNEPPSGI